MERLLIRKDYNELSEDILKKMLLNNYLNWKKRTSNPAEIEEIDRKIGINMLELQHLTRERLNNKK